MLGRARACALERAEDDLQGGGSARGGAGRRVAAVGGNRRGARHEDVRAAHDGPREADDRLVRRVPRDRSRCSTVPSIAARGSPGADRRVGPQPHAAAGVHRPPKREIAVRGETERVFRWASVTEFATALASWSPPGRRSLDLDEPSGPPRVDPSASALPRFGAAVRGPAPILAPRGRAADLFEHRLRRPWRSRRRAGRMPFAAPSNAGSRAARDGRGSLRESPSRAFGCSRPGRPRR